MLSHPYIPLEVGKGCCECKMFRGIAQHEYPDLLSMKHYSIWPLQVESIKYNLFSLKGRREIGVKTLPLQLKQSYEDLIFHYNIYI